MGNISSAHISVQNTSITTYDKLQISACPNPHCKIWVSIKFYIFNLLLVHEKLYSISLLYSKYTILCTFRKKLILYSFICWRNRKTVFVIAPTHDKTSVASIT